MQAFPGTVEHNALLVNGQGQGKEGTHDAWHGLPYSQLDTIQDAIFTEILHSDTTIGQRGAGEFTIPKESHALKVEVSTVGAELTSRIEPNIVIGPGNPGSVDKGVPEWGGERLDVTTRTPATTVQIRWSLIF